MKGTAIVTSEGQISLPIEFKKQLKPGDKYTIVVTEKSLILEKIIKEKAHLDHFLKELENIEPDADKPSLEEISTVVKEVRQKLWT
ncbi:MAG: AbrB/MazE/SpoVT family DNA-binding domain-containing protein [Cyanobacterium sp. T60_A2020_053]|nr:AbrB/MazE/SpoVT family DNA-binding domain-containing protein [Cyanobacterium sp. T60_A2020_053]